MKKRDKVHRKLEKNLRYGNAQLSIEQRDCVINVIKERENCLNSDLSEWVKKIGFNSYKTLDSDVINLKKSGYSEQVIFEVSCLTAFTVADEILQKNLRLLK